MIRILIADDHDLIRAGLKQIISARRDWIVCAEARTGLEAVQRAKELRPEVAILDLSMPELDGLSAAKRIRDESPPTEILMLSAHCSDQLVRDILAADIGGFVVKGDSDPDLVAAITALTEHRPFFTTYAKEMMNCRPEGRADGSEPGTLKNRLTRREHEVVRLVSQGKTSVQTAAFLKISPKTVDTHRVNIKKKLKLHTTAQLARYALRNKIIEA